jgi:aryl-alcohol dehydrogenase-like predicted oxidoreductase
MPTTVELSGRFRIAGREVNRLGFGALHVTGPGAWGPPKDHDGAIRLLRRAVELGVDLIDTADSYGPGVSEEMIREALHPYGHVLIATKAGMLRPRQYDDEWPRCGRPDYLRQQCELSLRRLGVEVIDLFQLHAIDPTVPAEDQFGLLAELLAEGKVAAVGLSNVTVAELGAARQVVEVVTVQNYYNVADRASENVLEACERDGIGFIPWYPMGSGKLVKTGSALAEVAAASGTSPAQVAIAWLLQHSPVMLPIPGTSSVAHLEENCAAASVNLTAAQAAVLDAIFSNG